MINNDKKILVDKINKYIDIIKNEYNDLVRLPEINNLNNFVHIENTNTISLYVKNNHFYFPLDAYNVLEKFKNIKGYGSNKKHKTYTKNTLLNNTNNFSDYVNHLILIGATPLEYFEEVLLHEVLHFCGSRGSDALGEGINEYLTRKLALKYNLKTNGCGYFKEIKIVIELEKIFGSKIITKIAFSRSEEEIKKILNQKNPYAYEFLNKLTKVMNEEFYYKYYQYSYPSIEGVYDKVKRYNDIN